MFIYGGCCRLLTLRQQQRTLVATKPVNCMKIKAINIPLYILDVYGTCGCTVPEWPKGMIEPGRGGFIKVKFNSEGKTNEQRKLITVVANTFPVETLLYLDGIVTSKN